MTVSKLTIAREFCLGVGMTAFLCLAPQSTELFTLALFIGMFTIYETFPEFHWVPAWTIYKIVNKEEDMIQGAVRVATQFIAATLAGIIGYQLLNVNEKAVYPTFDHDDEWRALLWVGLVFGAWLALTNHSNQKDKDSFRRNFGLTATFCSANYLLQGVTKNCILNSAVNFGRLIGAKIYADGQSLEEVDLKHLWLVLAAPVVGVLLAKLGLVVDSAVADWDAPTNAETEETTAIAAYGATGAAADAKADLELAGDAKDAAENA